MANDEKDTVESASLENQLEDTVRISPEVIGIVTGIAAGEVEGIAGMSGGIVGGIAEKLGRKDFSKGIKVRLEGEKVSLDLSVVVDYGVRIMETAKKLKDKVRSTVEEVTGLPVAVINIHVIGINLPKEKFENVVPEVETGDA
ncbi:MAG: Asp23/Gls24 family envelope stress response protein [Firmicutes bacterium]|nr:Asp23/Gls24 family envelope stress response protein [Bacillota bacterium]